MFWFDGAFRTRDGLVCARHRVLSTPIPVARGPRRPHGGKRGGNREREESNMDDGLVTDRVARGLALYLLGSDIDKLTGWRRDFIRALAREAARLVHAAERPRRKRVR